MASNYIPECKYCVRINGIFISRANSCYLQRCAELEEAAREQLEKGVPAPKEVKRGNNSIYFTRTEAHAECLFHDRALVVGNRKPSPLSVAA